jgi:hypothetical protein
MHATHTLAIALWLIIGTSGAQTPRPPLVVVKYQVVIMGHVDLHATTARPCSCAVAQMHGLNDPVYWLVTYLWCVGGQAAAAAGTWACALLGSPHCTPAAAAAAQVPAPVLHVSGGGGHWGRQALPAAMQAIVACASRGPCKRWHACACSYIIIFIIIGSITRLNM